MLTLRGSLHEFDRNTHVRTVSLMQPFEPILLQVIPSVISLPRSLKSGAHRFCSFSLGSLQIAVGRLLSTVTGFQENITPPSCGVNDVKPNIYGLDNCDVTFGQRLWFCSVV